MIERCLATFPISNEMKNIQKFKEALEKQRANLEVELSSIGRKNPDSNDWEATVTDLDVLPADENDVADMFEELEENKALINPLEEQLREVNSALERIQAGKFGICEVCGVDVEEDRLDAYPSARTCKAHLD